MTGTDQSNSNSFGTNALNNNSGSGSNSAFGHEALRSGSSTNTTAMGFEAEEASTSTSSLFLGWRAGRLSNTDRSTFIGALAGNAVSGIDNITLVGYGVGGGNTFEDVHLFGYNLSADTSNQVKLGSSLTKFLKVGETQWHVDNAPTDGDIYRYNGTTSQMELTRGSNYYGEMFITPSNIDTLTFLSGSTDTLQLASANQGLIDGFSYASGTLTYNGTDTIVANINYNLAFSFTEPDDILGAIYVNNVKIEKSEFQSTIKTANDFANASGTILYQLAPSDEIRFYLEVEAHNGDDDLIVREFDLNVIEIK
jgi:hypothetical protein